MKMIKRNLLLILSLFFASTVCYAEGFYRNHYHIIVDQTASIQGSYVKPQIDELLSILVNEFKSPDGKLNFDPTQDEISLYAFGIDGAGMSQSSSVTYYRLMHARQVGESSQNLYDDFLKHFIQYRGSYSTSGLNKDEFLDTKVKSLFYSNDELAKKISQSGGVTLSKYVYPAIIEVMEKNKTKPSVDDILILVTDYQSGSSDLGTSQDAKVLKDWLGGNVYADFVKNFNNLEAPFYKVAISVPIIDSHASGNSYPLIDANKLAIKSLEGVNPYMESNLSLYQKAHRGTMYDMSNVQISFNHGDDLYVEKVVLTIKQSDNLIYTEQIEDHKHYYNTLKKTYEFPEHKIDLQHAFSEGDSLLLNYTFYTMVNLGEGSTMSKVYTVTRDFEFADEHIISSLEDTTTIVIMATVVVVLLIIAAIIAYWAYKRRGRDCKIDASIKVGTISNERFLRVKDNAVTNYDCWYWDGIYNQRGITVYLSLNIARPKFSKRYKYVLEAKVADLDANYDFSFKPNPSKHIAPQGGVYSEGEWVPIDLKEMKFHILAYLEPGKDTPDFNIDNILKMGVEIRLKRILENGVVEYIQFQNGQNSLKEVYSFIVRPKLNNSNLWVALDPGTSGSCVAYGVAGAPTDRTDLFVAQNMAHSLSGSKIYSSVFPSKIRILKDSKRLADGDVIDAESLVEGEDFEFGNKAEILWGNFNSFQSIKKLLGYHNDQKILIRKGGKNLIKDVSGKDLAHLLVKGLCNHFDRFIISNENNLVEPRIREEFMSSYDGTHLGVERAIVAVPNSYTLDKIQDMVDSVDRTKRFKEVHYIYESEAVFMTYLRENWAQIGEAQHGKIFIVYDMGGATINITAFKINVELDSHANVDTVYVTTLSKIGYTIGGDDIDFALIQMLYGLPTIKPALAHLKTDNDDWEDVILKHQQTHKDKLLAFVRDTKLDIISKLRGEESNDGMTKYKIQDAETFYGHIVALFKDLGVHLEMFDEDVQRYLNDLNNEFIVHDGCSFMQNYVLEKVRDAMDELLKTIPATEPKKLEMIFSGRSVLYPNVKKQVYEAINVHKFEFTEWDGLKVNGVESAELVKTAVAKGACWFGMYNSRVRLDHSILTTTLGYIDNKNATEVFVPLLTPGARFEHGELQSEQVAPIYTNLSDVRFVQMMGANYDDIWQNDLSHKYSLIARKRQDVIIGNIEYISMNTNECGEVGCAIKLMMSSQEMRTNLSGTMRLDITDDNSSAYIFATTNANIEKIAEGDEVELYEGSGSTISQSRKQKNKSTRV